MMVATPALAAGTLTITDNAISNDAGDDLGSVIQATTGMKLARLTCNSLDDDAGVLVEVFPATHTFHHIPNLTSPLGLDFGPDRF